MPANGAVFCTAWCASVKSANDLLLTPFSTAMIWLSLGTISPLKQRVR